MNKVVLIGCGNVGMSYAFALVNQKTNIEELVLIDLDKEKIIGEAMDLNHCLAFSPGSFKIKAGNYDDCSDATIVVIAAGANQEVGETRMNLIEKNSKIFKKIIFDVVGSGFEGIFLIATNPLDVMTHLTYKYSNFPASRVIGSGTSLDTSRLRYLIGDKLRLNTKNVHAHIIGEHGDSEFAHFSCASIGTQPITDYISFEELSKIEEDVRNAAAEIIKRKGSTCYGIGSCLVKITNAILDNENSMITVSCYDASNDVYIGRPAVLNNTGVRSIPSLSLTDIEKDKYDNSVNVIKSAIDSVL